MSEERSLENINKTVYSDLKSTTLPLWSLVNMEIQPTLKPLNFVILVSCLLILSLAPPLSAYDVLYERERKVLSDLNNDKSERIKHFFKGIKKNATQLSKDVELLSAFEELRELHYYFKDNESNIKDVKASYNYNTQDK